MAPGDGVVREVIVSIRQLGGDSPRFDVDWPDSVDPPRAGRLDREEARLIGGFMVAAAGLLDEPR